MGSSLARLLFGLVAVIGMAACASRSQPAGPPIGPAVSTADAIYTEDGYRLPLQVWRPDGDPQAAIVAAHGFDDYVRA
ncbi:MAG: alpha/beta hydrolase, partial [Pseudomonadota bacterium]